MEVTFPEIREIYSIWIVYSNWIYKHIYKLTQYRTFWGVSGPKKPWIIFSNIEALQERNQIWLQYHDTKHFKGIFALTFKSRVKYIKNIKSSCSKGSILVLHAFELCSIWIIFKRQTDLSLMTAHFLDILFLLLKIFDVAW